MATEFGGNVFRGIYLAMTQGLSRELPPCPFAVFKQSYFFYHSLRHESVIKSIYLVGYTLRQYIAKKIILFRWVTESMVRVAKSPYLLGMGVTADWFYDAAPPPTPAIFTNERCMATPHKEGCHEKTHIISSCNVSLANNSIERLRSGGIIKEGAPCFRRCGRE